MGDFTKAISGQLLITGEVPIGLCIVIGIIIFIAGMGFNTLFLVLFQNKEQNKAKEIIKRFLANLDNIIMAASGFIFIITAIFDYYDIWVSDGAALSFLTIFSSLIFSWLLTKKSSSIAFKMEQEKMAKLSHRHLGDVEKAVLGIELSINEHLDKEPKTDVHSKYFMKGINSRINDIKNGIMSNKLDWYDMLSEDYKEEVISWGDPEVLAASKRDSPDLSELKEYYQSKESGETKVEDAG